MLRQGFVEEVETLMKKATTLVCCDVQHRVPGNRTIFNGGMTMEEAVYKIKTGTHRFIRHQYAWFRLKDERIKWFDIEKTNNGEIERVLEEFIKN